jgi:hypothetical protein
MRNSDWIAHMLATGTHDESTCPDCRDRQRTINESGRKKKYDARRSDRTHRRQERCVGNWPGVMAEEGG